MDQTNPLEIFIESKEYWRCKMHNSIWPTSKTDDKIWCGHCKKTHLRKEMGRATLEDFKKEYKK